jgi:sodium transport system ATP-binding protein
VIAVEIEGLGKVFPSRKGDVIALDRLTFRVPLGTIFGLLGPNGAGKTTALRILATILRPTHGTARIEGIDVAAQPSEARRKIGYLTGDTGLYGRLTPRETVAYFARLHGMNEHAIRTRADELFCRLGIAEFADRPNDKLSSGMKQKVSIARALIHDPPVLILDEPTSNLDVLAARVILDFMRDAKAAGKTVLFSSHNMLQAEKLCDALAVIHRGRILAEGTLDELRGRTGRRDLEEIFVGLVGDAHAPA